MSSFKTILISAILLTMFLGLAVAAPSGASITPGSSSHATADSAGTADAIAGNVTELSVDGQSVTQAWQGYYGNVTGAIRLADSSDHVMYNWSTASPRGEIYSSNTSSITWANIACFDLAANGAGLETSFGIGAGDSDGINETFQYHDHPEFFTNNVQFSAGQCNDTKVFDNTGTGTFYEVLLTDGASPVFTSILKQDATGFDGNTHDFEMLVPENGHGTDTSVTPYYFWVELE